MIIQGLEKFRGFFAGYEDQYALIGGLACYLAMRDVGLDFRATKDFDMVLCVEAMTPEFGERLWQFVREGDYQHQETSSGRKQFYRFYKPGNTDYPLMLELFSRKPDTVILGGEPHLTPIPMDEDISSLSAILLDEDYYQCIALGKQNLAGIEIVGPEYILPFKARAWLDLSARKAGGSHVDSKNIRKHRNDVFRLINLLSPARTVDLPSRVAADLHEFVSQMPAESGLQPKDFGVNTSLETALAMLVKIYRL